MLKKLLLPLWILGGIALLLYSYTQVDLSLTLSQASIFQQIQKAFQYIGWYMRPFSTYLYIGIIAYLFGLFIYTLSLSIKKQISTRELKVIIISVAVILLPSYNAFSYDLFNYIFDARIISFYHLNPYEYKPMDFPGDPMLSFMRSIHRVYPYGPSWLLITAPLTFLANEIFLFSLALFKALSVLSYLGTIWLIYKIAVILNLKNINRAIVLFALNPLVLVEALVSSHNEIVMMFLVTLGIYFYFRDKKVISFLSIAFSIGVKYSTIVFLPILIIRIFFKKISDQRIIDFVVFLSIFAAIATSLASGPNKGAEFQPWYLLLIAPFISITNRKIFRVIFLFMSFVVLFAYVPFLYEGVWPQNIVMYKNLLVFLGFLFGVAVYGIFRFKKIQIA